MKRTFIALVVGFIFLVPVTGWSAQPGDTLPKQVASLEAKVASLAAQVAELKGQVANLTTQLNNEVATRQAALIPIHPPVGITFNELYGQVAQTGCGWLEVESKEGDISVYHVAHAKPGCNQKNLYHFQDDKLIKIE
jgi:outer membrane murein-binding lipoprotein Lpp